MLESKSIIIIQLWSRWPQSSSSYNGWQLTNIQHAVHISLSFRNRVCCQGCMEKMFISWEASQFSHNLLCFLCAKSCYQIPKFPTKFQLFLGKSFPVSTFFLYHVCCHLSFLLKWLGTYNAYSFTNYITK